MDTVEHKGKDQRKTLPKDYLEKVVDALPISDEVLECDLYYKHMVLGLLAQQNLLLDKMCNLMMISTGLMDHDIPIDTADIQSSTEKAVGKSFPCPNCSNIVVPDRLGYCPKCKQDLRSAIMRNED